MIGSPVWTIEFTTGVQLVTHELPLSECRRREIPLERIAAIHLGRWRRWASVDMGTGSLSVGRQRFGHYLDGEQLDVKRDEIEPLAKRRTYKIWNAATGERRERCVYLLGWRRGPLARYVVVDERGRQFWLGSDGDSAWLSGASPSGANTPGGSSARR